MKGGELNETPPQFSWVPNQVGKLEKQKKGWGGGKKKGLQAYGIQAPCKV